MLERKCSFCGIEYDVGFRFLCNCIAAKYRQAHHDSHQQSGSEWFGAEEYLFRHKPKALVS